MEPKPPRASYTVLSQFMLPEHANTHGNVHGGWIMKLVDEVGAIAAMRHCRCPSVTVAIDSMTFDAPVVVGELVTLEASVTYVGRTSMEVMVRVYSENLLTGKSVLTNTAYVVYVALDAQRRPTAVPGLEIETDDERTRFEQGRERQRLRLERAQRELR